MAQHDAVPSEHDVTRWIKPKLMSADDKGDIETDRDGRPLFIFPQAFALRDDEEYLSVTWVDFFGPHRLGNLKAAADAFRESTDSKRLAAKSAFAVANVAKIAACCREHGHSVRIVEEPVDSNDGHAAIRRYPRDVGELQDRLAGSVFLERWFYNDLK